MKKRLWEAIYQYVVYAVAIGAVMLLYMSNKYYSNFLRPETKLVLLGLYAAYMLFAFPFYYLFPKKDINQHKGVLLFRAFKRVLAGFWHYLRKPESPAQPTPGLSRQEKVAVLFMLVKFFFLPLMINFLFDNYLALVSNSQNLSGFSFTVDFFLNVAYGLILTLFFTVDTLFFAFGYTFEAGFLGNNVRSVEPTFFGWFVALICYPPFNGLVGNYVNWYPQDFSSFGSVTLTVIMRIAVLVFIGIYVSATIALGTKSSNLTNRGIVASGPYRYIRHPAYISKNMAWFVTILPIFSLQALLGVAFWMLIYFGRAITEERHLIQDPDYQDYCRKVRWRFIPYVF